MEKLEDTHQAIQEHHDDHVGTGEQASAMRTSADLKEAPWQAEWHDRGTEQLLVPTGDDRGFNATIRKRGIDTGSPRSCQIRSFARFGYFIFLIASLWIIPASAVFVQFDNCLDDSVKKADWPFQQLQFVPLMMNAKFDTKDASHTLEVVVWGNVTGSGPGRTYNLPGVNDSYWASNDTSKGGKIVDIPQGNDSPDPKLTTLFNKVDVLTYTPWSNSVDFCDQLVNGTCPLSPKFPPVNGSDPSNWPSINISTPFNSTYAFTTFTATMIIKYGDENATTIGCISADITPDLGATLSNVIKFVPMIILVFVGFATAFAGIFSPWGTTDTFRWTSNYGRDDDLLRLVTPGFGDCLQYIQFVALTGGLTLNYPGFYQPVVSKVTWSTLMFNQSFVSNGPPTASLIDGIYVTDGRFGLDKLRQLVGMSNVNDIWAGMAIWLLVIIAAVLALIQIGFLLRWVYRHVNKTPEEDLRAKNMPFSVGNVIRLVFNYFLLPIVALSMFQLVEFNSPRFTVGLAVTMFALIVGFAIWLLYLIASTRPKSYLFDDLPTVLLYGPLYNTYSDNTASFALVPVLLSIIRGVAIGAVQPSGIAQLVLLAICEVIFILTLHAFRPFHSPTSMNAFHTFFSFLRLATVLLMVSFAPSLGVSDGPKGWIGYSILLMHTIVLIFGFLLNAVQTIVEVAALMAGAGSDASGASRGGLARVFGVRQLSRRLPRRDGPSRQSQLSSAAMLDSENDRKAYLMEGSRLRSQSAGSTGILLNRQSTGLDSINIDAYGATPTHHVASGASSYTPTTPREASTFSFLPSTAAPSGLGRDRGPIVGLGAGETTDPYYRPPRFRRPTIDAYSPGTKSRGSWASGDWANKRWSQPDLAGTTDQIEEGPSISGRATPVLEPPAAESSPEPKRSAADYTTREVDFYYGVRGPALNANVPSRRIKTGPADPTGPAASAAGWFKGFFGGKTKEQGKGFEVVRSARMPPGMKRPGQESPPEGVPVATGVVRNGPIDSDDESIRPRERADTVDTALESAHENDNLVSPLQSEDEESQDEEGFEMTRISDVPPTLPGIEVPGGGLDIPSRFPSKATSKASSEQGRAAKMTEVPLVPGLPSEAPSLRPDVPRKSSRRKSLSVDLTQAGAHLFQQYRPEEPTDSSRLPFERTNSHNRQSTISTNSSNPEPLYGRARIHSSALGNLGADFRDDRPTSVGFVNHHSITINQNENPDFLGTSGVIEEGRTSGASSLDHSRH